MKLPIRPVLALAAATAMLAGGAVATAAPKAKPACNALTDVAGDATGFVVTDPGPTPNTPTLDILSGDLGADAKTLTAVLRLSDMTTTDSSAPTGRNYVVLFTSGEKKLYLAAVLDGSGTPTFTAGWVDARRTKLSDDVTGVVDLVKKEIRISAPLSAFAAQAALKPGGMLTDLNAYSQRFIGAAGAGITPTSDVAEGGQAYAIASASCVVPGK